MKKRGIRATWLAAFLLVGLIGCSTGPRYTVTRVIDGDTIEITDAGGIRTRVRLRRVNAPELDEPGGEAAKAALEAELLGKRVKVRPCAIDVYGRTIGDVAPD